MNHNAEALSNKFDYFNHTQIDENTIEAKLWALLDDIDTASDMFKPEQTPFYKYVMKKAKERFKHITSDGYSLFKPNKTQ